MRIVASNPDAIGDLILRQPFYAALRQAGHELLLLVRPPVRPFVPLVAPGAAALDIPVEPYGFDPAVPGAGLGEFLAAVHDFRADALVLAPYQLTRFDEHLAAALPGVPVYGMTGFTFGKAAPGERPPPEVRFAAQAAVAELAPEVEKNRRLCELLLGGPAELGPPRLEPGPAQLDAARALLERHGLSPDGYWLACVGEDPHNAVRNWPLEKWATALHHAAREHGWRFLLLGSEPEHAALDAVRRAMGPAAESAVLPRPGESSPDALVGLAALARGYVGRDTGPMHLAAALGKPVLALFSGGHWPRFVPAAAVARALTVQVPCSPCGDVCHLPESYCVREVPVADVCAAIDELHAGAGGCVVRALARPADLAVRMEWAAARAARARLWEGRRLHLQLIEARRQAGDLGRQVLAGQAAVEELRLRQREGLAARAAADAELQRLAADLDAARAQYDAERQRRAAAEEQLARARADLDAAAEELRAERARAAAAAEACRAAQTHRAVLEAELHRLHDSRTEFLAEQARRAAAEQELLRADAAAHAARQELGAEQARRAAAEEASRHLTAHVQALLQSRWRKLGRALRVVKPIALEAPPVAGRVAAPLRVHIGHHFYGAGNLGDDLMLAGFLDACARRGLPLRLTCASPFDRDGQRRRFPAVEWLPYEPADREEAVRTCDVWLGLGGSPFQTDCGPWLLDHLAGERELCRRHGKPMYFLGVGLNNRAALDDPRVRELLGHAAHVWTRDGLAARELAAVIEPDRITAGADLAHLFLRHRPFGPPAPDRVGWLLHFERPEAFCPAALAAAVDGTTAVAHDWLVQEVRPLPGSEQVLYAALPDELRVRLAVHRPDYAAATVDELLAAWPSPGTVVSSRYHGALVAAWRGARLVCVERNDKLTGLAEQLGAERLPDFTDTDAVRRALGRAAPVRRTHLAELARAAEGCCEEFFRVLDGMAADCRRRPPSPAARGAIGKRAASVPA